MYNSPPSTVKRMPFCHRRANCDTLPTHPTKKKKPAHSFALDTTHNINSYSFVTAKLSTYSRLLSVHWLISRLATKVIFAFVVDSFFFLFTYYPSMCTNITARYLPRVTLLYVSLFRSYRRLNDSFSTNRCFILYSVSRPIKFQESAIERCNRVAVHPRIVR